MIRKKDNRPGARQRGYDTRWQKVREVKISINPLCERCLIRGKTIRADIVHHILPVDKYPGSRLDLNNLESLCNWCHEQHHKGKSQGVNSHGLPVDSGHPWNQEP